MPDATFSFVDLAGYTAASFVHGDDLAAELAIRLRDLASDSAGTGDEIIKSIGDAVMCRSADPPAALQWLSRLFLASEREHQFPQLRAGSHHGSAVEHAGDYYGTTVNVAARVAALAEPCQLLVTDPMVPAARQLGWLGPCIGDRALRNIAEPVTVWEVNLPTTDAEAVVDPVCHMRVTADNAVLTTEHHGRVYWFCSTDCLDAFAGNPDHYANR